MSGSPGSSRKKVCNILLSEEEDAFLSSVARRFGCAIGSQARALLLAWASIVMDEPGACRGGRCATSGCEAVADWWHTNRQRYVCGACSARINSAIGGAICVQDPITIDHLTVEAACLLRDHAAKAPRRGRPRSSSTIDPKAVDLRAALQQVLDRFDAQHAVVVEQEQRDWMDFVRGVASEG